MVPVAECNQNKSLMQHYTIKRATLISINPIRPKCRIRRLTVVNTFAHAFMSFMTTTPNSLHGWYLKHSPQLEPAQPPLGRISRISRGRCWLGGRRLAVGRISIIVTRLGLGLGTRLRIGLVATGRRLGLTSSRRMAGLGTSVVFPVFAVVGEV